jgi:hypothetical protein
MARKVTCVNASVILEVAGGAEGLGTKLALVIFLARVDASVDDEAVFASKVFTTILALVLLFFSVDGNAMIFEVTPLPEVAAAQLTLVGFVSRVESHVYFQGASSKETLPTNLKKLT